MTGCINERVNAWMDGGIFKAVYMWILKNVNKKKKTKSNL